MTRGPFRSIRCRFPSSIPAVVVTDVVKVGGVIDAAVVTVSVRSFFLKRSRDVSSCSVELLFPLVNGTDFFEVASFCDVGDFVSLVSAIFLLDVLLLGDSEELKLLVIIDGFSNIFGTICGELPNFELFSASGLLNEVNDRNSVFSVLSFVADHAGTNLLQDDNEPPNKLLMPLDCGDDRSPVFVSVLIGNVDINGLVSVFCIFDGNMA